MLKRTFTEEIILTPEELAEEFWGMGHEEQARFFNYLAHISNIENDSSFDFQMCNVYDNGGIDKNGKMIWKALGEFL